MDPNRTLRGHLVRENISQILQELNSFLDTFLPCIMIFLHSKKVVRGSTAHIPRQHYFYMIKYIVVAYPN
jgi:hypothetical protein